MVGLGLVVQMIQLAISSRESGIVERVTFLSKKKERKGNF